MITTKNLSFAYNDTMQFGFPDFTCQKGAALLILGQSGKGKTTLLHLLAGLLQPKKGHILIGNTDIAGLTTSALDKFRGKHVGIVFQRSHFVAALTVKDNLTNGNIQCRKPFGR